MSAKKVTSPEAEQKKLWKLEIRDHEKARSKIRRDCRNEQKRLIKISETAHRDVMQFQSRVEKKLPKLERNIDRRIAFLKGRLGL
jgi:hypothetical protein